MLKDSRGITAFLDAMVFMGILVVALSMLSPGFSHADDGSPSASEVLDAMAASKVRMSDLSSDGDDSPVFLTDMAAYSVHTGDRHALEYIDAIMKAHCRGHPYKVTLSYGDSTEDLGEKDVRISSGASAVYPVTAGAS